MTTAQVVETSVTVINNSPIEDYVHLDDQTQPTIDTTLCQIATDLTTTFYQIPLAPKLVKYCSVGSSWIPIQWWVCQAQKLHWKSSCVMYLKILFHERVVAKISNISILRCLLTRGVTAHLKWVFQALSECNLKLSAFQDFYQPQIYHDVWLESSKPSSISSSFVQQAWNCRPL